MSETNETAEKPDEPPAGEGKLSNVSVDLSKKDSTVSMIEDEEMPTYSSISSSTKPNNSTQSYDQSVNDLPVEKNHSPSPEPSEDQDNDDNESVYVVSSTADTDRNPDDLDDEEEDDYDSEEMNEEDDDEDEDEDDEDQDDFDRDRFERESDDYEQDRFERASDDFVLRHNDSIKKYYKERSLSLQDLTTIEARYNRRKNYPRFQYYADKPSFKPNLYSPYALNSKPYQGAGKYDHIESKVKHYIHNIKEHEKLTKLRNPANTTESRDNKPKPIVAAKRISEYAEKVIKELEEKELDEMQVSTYTTLERMENGDEHDLEPLQLLSEKDPSSDIEPMEVDTSPLKKQINEKMEKVNGIIDFGVASEVSLTPVLKEVSVQRVHKQINGSEPSKNLINCRSVSYEEYMRGSGEEVEEEEEVEVEDEDEESPEVETESSDVCLISPEKSSNDLSFTKQNKINTNNQKRNVKSNCHDVTDDDDDQGDSYNYRDRNSIKMINQATETIRVENSEIKALKASLTQRNSQFDDLQTAYHRTLAENLAMKQELENLKKLLKKHEDYQNRERKSTHVQTENLLQETDKIKMSTTSLNSAISSIHPWSETGVSPSISVQSPDVRKTCDLNNSDDVLENTPKQPRTLSRAFITSSRILQTLSNITQRKWSASSPLAQREKNEEIKSTKEPSTSGTSLNSKKRKANEMLGTCNSDQPFKIPHTSGTGRKKLNQDSQMNGLPEDSLEDNKKDDDEEEEEDEKKKKDFEDNLKYYVYQDEENSKERSFLIQAEEPGKVPNKGSVRECGPYLLGNLEVRMTEVNGTINIWGKEINGDSTEEEPNLSGKQAEEKSNLSWQKTPLTNLLNNSFLSSTNKIKSKPQSRFNDSNTSKLSHSFDYASPRHPIQINRQSCHRRGSLTSDDNCTSHSRRLSWSGCKHLMEEQKYHSRHVDLECDSCGCSHNSRKCECHSCSRIQDCADNLRRHSYSGGSNKHLIDTHCLNNSSHCLKVENNTCFRHQRSPPVFNDGEKYHTSKHCHSSNEFTHSYNPKNILNSEYRDCSSSGCCQSRKSMNHDDDDEDDTLIEPPEVRKKRLSGKKVRTLLMDLLKGCGDCRAPNNANISKANVTGRDTHNPLCPPEIIVTQCSPRASCSSSPSMEKNRCCDTCSRRIAMAGEIETQLEFFRIEMERLRSRSDALLDKFNMLKSTD